MAHMKTPRPTSSVYEDSPSETRPPSRSSSFHSDDDCSDPYEVHSEPYEVYSEQFSLEELLEQLAEQAHTDNEMTQSLKNGDEERRPQPRDFQNEWNALCRALEAASDLAHELPVLIARVENEVGKARDSWKIDRDSI
ncbi:hypothetical protein K4F52_010203 [Lecanicillium sp. MT-2017a]|nr:hypothetical protein K4F52_010203 [Lecanicillium sp. MT-2017a]